MSVIAILQQLRYRLATVFCANQRSGNKRTASVVNNIMIKTLILLNAMFLFSPFAEGSSCCCWTNHLRHCSPE